MLADRESGSAESAGGICEPSPYDLGKRLSDHTLMLEDGHSRQALDYVWRNGRPGVFARQFATSAVVTALGIGMGLRLADAPWNLVFPVAIAGGVLFTWLMALRNTHRAARRITNQLGPTYRLAIHEGGLEISGDRSGSLLRWDQIGGIEIHKSTLVAALPVTGAAFSQPIPIPLDGPAPLPPKAAQEIERRFRSSVWQPPTVRPGA